MQRERGEDECEMGEEGMNQRRPVSILNVQTHVKVWLCHYEPLLAVEAATTTVK